MSITDTAREVPILDGAQRKLAAAAGQMADLAGPELGKVSAQVRARPLATLLVALGLGAIAGYLLKR